MSKLACLSDSDRLELFRNTAEKMIDKALSLLIRNIFPSFVFFLCRRYWNKIIIVFYSNKWFNTVPI